MTTIATLRKRNMTAAKRSLTLIRDAVLTHLDILEDGGVPESSFTASLAKYETALITLRTLDALGEDCAGTGPADDDTVEVRRDDLEALVLFAREFTTEAGRPPGSPLGNLTQAVYPDGPPGEPE